MRAARAAIIVGLWLVIAGSVSLLTHPTEAHHGAPYGPNVRAARQWLREHTTDRGFRAAHVLWERESGWWPKARTGSCWGIPQACPGSKMAAAGPDWRRNATTQVRWGTHYVRGRYGTFRRALWHQRVHGWY